MKKPMSAATRKRLSDAMKASHARRKAEKKKAHEPLLPLATPVTIRAASGFEKVLRDVAMAEHKLTVTVILYGDFKTTGTKFVEAFPEALAVQVKKGFPEGFES